jgi:hypothetical protein
MNSSTRFGWAAARGAALLVALLLLRVPAFADAPNEVIFPPVQFTDPNGNTKIVWHIAAPNVTYPRTSYDGTNTYAISFQPGDKVLVAAGGFLNRGGNTGVRDYVYSNSPGKTDFNPNAWAGTISIPGVTDSTGWTLSSNPNTQGMVRLSTLLSQQKGNTDPDGMTVQGLNGGTLTLGYEDEDNGPGGDNSYGGLYGQQIAWVTITITRPATNPPPSKKQNGGVGGGGMEKGAPSPAQIDTLLKLKDYQALTGLMKHVNPQVRISVAQKVGAVGPQARAMVPALVAALKDPHPEVRKAAAEALHKIDPVAARKAGAK